MAKILFLTFTNMPGLVLDNFRQALVEALCKEGNDVLILRSNDFMANCQESNQLREDLCKKKLLQEIIDFQPDLILSMNHSGIFPGLADALHCPIAVWLLDGPAYLVDAQECRKRNLRYKMLIPVRAFRNDLKEAFGFPDSNIIYLPFASDFEPCPHEFKHNIAFIGTYFSDWRFRCLLKQQIHDRAVAASLRDLLNSYETDSEEAFGLRLKRLGLSELFTNDFDEAFLLNNISLNRRMKVLDAVEELGLTVYGNSEWLNCTPFSNKLALSFNPTILTKRSDLEDVYNSSRINLNVSHAQARGGLPWRVFDVMACNGAIVSDFQEDLNLLFPSDLEIPTYKSPAEARELCKKLLNDESRRAALVQSCQTAIEAGHRLRHRIASMSESLGLDLQPGGDGKLRFLETSYFTLNDPRSGKSFKKENLAQDKFTLQLFQSQSLLFDPANSQVIELDLQAPCKLQCCFAVNASLKYLRFDIGEYYSKHANVDLVVSLRDKHKNCVIDLKNNLLATNQFNFDGQILDCGFDSYCVFANPFAGQNVLVSFASDLVLRT